MVRGLLEHVATEFDRGRPARLVAASAELMCSRLAREVATYAVQVLGPNWPPVDRDRTVP